MNEGRRPRILFRSLKTRPITLWSPKRRKRVTAKNTAPLITRARCKTKTIAEHTQQGCSLQCFNNIARNGYLSSTRKRRNVVRCMKKKTEKGKFEWQINDTEALVFSFARGNLPQCILYYPCIIENSCRVAYNDTNSC